MVFLLAPVAGTTQALTIVASAAEHANTTVKKGVTELSINAS